MDQLRSTLSRLQSLTEAGRVLSAANEAKIRAAAAAIQGVLSSLASGKAVTEADRTGALTEARALIEAETSFSDKERLIRAAVRATYLDTKAYVYLRDVFDAFCIYEYEDGSFTYPSSSKLYKVAYAIVDTTVTLGTPVEVVSRTVYEPVGMPTMEASRIVIAGDVIPLVESVELNEFSPLLAGR